MPTRDDYQAAYAVEVAHEYPEIDAYEARLGFRVSQLRLCQAAAVLACPVKKNPPNWQHGRVIYATLCAYLQHKPFEHFTMLDIGTAKGFSALCMVWALVESARRGSIYSVDVINPKMAIRRNTIAEVDGLKTLAEILQPWPEAAHVTFLQSMGVDFLSHPPASVDRIHFAFVDGKHSFKHVAREAELLRARQESGDVIIFDDCQIPGVSEAIAATLPGAYHMTIVKAKTDRFYCVATKE